MVLQVRIAIEVRTTGMQSLVEHVRQEFVKNIIVEMRFCISIQRQTSKQSALNTVATREYRQSSALWLANYPKCSDVYLFVNKISHNIPLEVICTVCTTGEVTSCPSRMVYVITRKGCIACPCFFPPLTVGDSTSRTVRRLRTSCEGE